MRESKKARHSYPSGSDANTTTPENARQLVFSARARLSHTTEDYLAACQLLASTCVPQPRSSNQHSRELVLSTIDIELLTLKQEEERIQNAHKTLIDARNRAKMTAPIYSLPLETLARIFLEAVCHHAHDELERPTRFPSSPVTLSAVCRLWRNIAINARSLWAHLDILIGGASRRPRYPPSQLWVHRLQGTPLRVHIRQYDFTLPQHPGNPDRPINLDLSDSNDSDSSESWDDSGDSSDSDDSDDPGTSAATQYPVPPTSHISLSSLTSFLIPLMAHVDSLELISSLRCQFFLYSMLDRLVGDHEKSIPMRAVRIIHDEERDPLQFKMSRPLIRHYSQDHKAFFSSLVALDLRSVYPLKEHLTLTNLVELRLETPNLNLKKMYFVTQTELSTILESCPKLRSLMLFGLLVTPAPARARPRPVVLRDLRVLSLRCIAWDGELERVISIIHPGPHPLHLSVQLPEEAEPDPRLLAGLLSFFHRSNVTIFHADSFAFHTWFASQLGPLPNVHTLALKGCHVSDAAGFSIRRRRNPCPINPSVILWPQLRNLYLIRCGLDKAHLCRLLSLHAIRKVYLHRCSDDALPDDDLLITPQFLEECRMLLSDLAPNIEIVVNDAHDDPADWLFVGMPLE